MRRTPFGWPVEPDVYWMKAASSPRPSGAPTGAALRGQLVRGDDGRERRDRARQKAGHGARAGDRHHEDDAGVGEDRRLAHRVVFEPVEANGRVDRDRHRAREQDAGEGTQEVEAGGEHQRDGLAGPHPARNEPAGHGGGLVPQAAVGHRHLVGPLVAVEEDVHALGVEPRVAEERLVKRGDARADVGGGAERAGVRWRRRKVQRESARRLEERAGEAGRRVDHEAAVVERAAERALESREQLDALEAAEADLPLERGAFAHGALGADAARLAGESADDREHALLDGLEARLDPVCAAGVGHHGTLGPGCRARNARTPA